MHSKCNTVWDPSLLSPLLWSPILFLYFLIISAYPDLIHSLNLTWSLSPLPALSSAGFSLVSPFLSISYLLSMSSPLLFPSLSAHLSSPTILSSILSPLLSIQLHNFPSHLPCSPLLVTRRGSGRTHVAGTLGTVQEFLNCLFLCLSCCLFCFLIPVIMSENSWESISKAFEPFEQQ